MSEFIPRKVMVGDEEVTLSRFKGLKAIEAAAVVVAVTEAVPDLQDQINSFTKEYMENNSETITPAMALLPRYRELGLSPEDIANEPEGRIAVPTPPSPQQQFMKVLPVLFQRSREELTRLIGVVAIPNTDLEKADDEGDVAEVTLAYGKMMVRRGYVEQLAELLIVSWEVIGEQFSAQEDLVERLGELPFLRALRSMGQNQTPDQSPENSDVTEADQIVEEVLAENPESPTSSTPSPMPMDGTGELSSSASPGPNSSD